MKRASSCPTCGQTPAQAGQRTPLKSALVTALAGLSGLYLLNPGMGIFEALPDNLPLVGQLDEGVATLLLLACLSYFGIRLPFPVPVPVRRRS